MRLAARDVRLIFFQENRSFFKAFLGKCVPLRAPEGRKVNEVLKEISEYILGMKITWINIVMGGQTKLSRPLKARVTKTVHIIACTLTQAAN